MMKRVALLCSHDRHYTRDLLKLSVCPSSAEYLLSVHNLGLNNLDVDSSGSNQVVDDLFRICDALADQLSILSLNGITSTGDYPGSIIASIVAHKLGLPAPSTKALLLCNHKFYARQQQQISVPEAVPDFQIIDPHTFCSNDLVLSYPFFLKPVKAYFSIHANRVENEKQLEKLLKTCFLSPTFLSPFDVWLKQYTDCQYGAHCFIAESLLEGQQTTVEGFVQNGTVSIIGIVDSIMFDNNISFKRFEYPSSLSNNMQERMAQLAVRCIQGSGLDNTLFNIEMIYNSAHDMVHIIEINPRIAAQFADLYQRVDGTNSYELLCAVATGTQPQLKKGQGNHASAASCVLRMFDNKRVIKCPSDQNLALVHKQFPDVVIEIYAKEGAKLSDQLQDGKSYRYGLVNLGASCRQELLNGLEAVKKLLDFVFEPV